MATVIALIALIALDRYTLMTKDARVLRLEIISHHFMTAAATLRTKFLLTKAAKIPGQLHTGLLIDGQLIYLSSDGWPASFTAPINQRFQPSDEDCSRLWALLLQDPAPITTGQFTDQPRKYRAYAQTSACRYELASGEAYFDYFPLTGRLLFSDINEKSLKE